MVLIGLRNSVTALPTCSTLWQSLPPADGSFGVEAAYPVSYTHLTLPTSDLV